VILTLQKNKLFLVVGETCGCTKIKALLQVGAELAKPNIDGLLGFLASAPAYTSILENNSFHPLPLKQA